MTKIIAGMTMSLDGYVSDGAGKVGALYSDFDQLRDTEPLKGAIRDTGAVLMGWRTFAMAADPDAYADSYEFQVPIFVVTHQLPLEHPKEAGTLTFTLVTDGLVSAVEQARAAAGERDVTIVGGATTVQRCLEAGLVDELQIDVMPVLLGGGLRFFGAGTRQLGLEQQRVTESPSGRTHLTFRVVKEKPS